VDNRKRSRDLVDAGLPPLSLADLRAKADKVGLCESST
jgi:hypothetical protein